MIEVIVVLALVAAMAMMAAPKISTARERSAMTSARQQLTATLASARAAAIQKARPAELRVTGGVVTVRSWDMKGAVQVVAPTDYAAQYGVTLTVANAGDALVTFMPRGITDPMLTPPRFILQRGALKDSVCLSARGQILPRGCQQ